MNIPCKSLKFHHTPSKTNMSPENQWLEDVCPIEIDSPFLGEHVSLRECKNQTDLFFLQLPSKQRTDSLH